VEYLAECAAIKTHTNLNFLVRRNLIFDTLHGAGIWIDYINSNSRITQNVVVNTGSNNGPGPGLGAIFVEKAVAPNMVDHNFVWGCTHTNGMYEYTAKKLLIANNMVGNCAAAGLMLLDIPIRTGAPRPPNPAKGTSVNNTVVNNILVNNGWNIGFQSTNNVSDHNAFGPARLSNAFHLLSEEIPLNASFEPLPLPFKAFDLGAWRKTYGFDRHSSAVDIAAEFDPKTLELVWSVRGDVPEGLPIEGLMHDFWNRPRAGRPAVPGPFGDIPKQSTRIVVDPRLTVH
jgi:hypothetical protein